MSSGRMEKNTRIPERIEWRRLNKHKNTEKWGNQLCQNSEKGPYSKNCWVSVLFGFLECCSCMVYVVKIMAHNRPFDLILSVGQWFRSHRLWACVCNKACIIQIWMQWLQNYSIQFKLFRRKSLQIKTLHKVASSSSLKWIQPKYNGHTSINSNLYRHIYIIIIHINLFQTDIMFSEYSQQSSHESWNIILTHF